VEILVAYQNNYKNTQLNIKNSFTIVGSNNQQSYKSHKVWGVTQVANFLPFYNVTPWNTLLLIAPSTIVITLDWKDFANIYEIFICCEEVESCVIKRYLNLTRF
jgi:hypothetical protein